jgi:hypothetical protein
LFDARFEWDPALLVDSDLNRGDRLAAVPLEALWAVG